MKITKLLPGHFRISGEYFFSNLKREGREWAIDLRRRATGDLVEVGSLWTRKSDAIEEAERLIAARDALHIPSDVDSILSI